MGRRCKRQLQINVRQTFGQTWLINLAVASKQLLLIIFANWSALTTLIGPGGAGHLVSPLLQLGVLTRKRWILFDCS